MMNLIKIYYFVLFQPEEITNYIIEIDKKFLIVHRLIISFFISGSIILLKNRVISIHFLMCLFLIVLFYFIIHIVSYIISSFYFYRISEFTERYFDEPFNKITKIIKELNIILELGWLPLIFLIQFSIISNYFNSILFFILGLIVLLIWKFFIWWKGLQYHLEWNSKISVKILIKNILILFTIPLSHFLLLVIIVFIFM